MVRATAELASVRDARQLDEWLHKKSVDWRFNFYTEGWLVKDMLEDLSVSGVLPGSAGTTKEEGTTGADCDRFIKQKRGIRKGQVRENVSLFLSAAA